MILDLRFALAWMFLAIGFQLVVNGILSSGRAASMNLTWGSIIAVAGAAFYLWARGRGKR